MHVVLVHGSGGSDRSWSSVLPRLAERGIAATAADNPSQSLYADVERVRAIIGEADDDVLLVGHSYGGAVITDAGRHDRVRGLVYVAAFAPDQGESVQQIVNSYPPAEVSASMTRGPGGEWIYDRSPEARAALAWDVPDEIWERHGDDRVCADAIFTETTGSPAWASRPSWYLLATRDKHLRVEAQRDMAERAGARVSEAATSHAVPHAAPDAVVAVIEDALATLAR
ncbi:MAG: alpha/beta hydrolase [Nocardioides sp.]|uniref:alpha/beta fold hydrolase n=1 Tax=Nocardioides sp. TaxID=35761 RepID=UPI0039E39A67